jgi:hypothetical protein
MIAVRLSIASILITLSAASVGSAQTIEAGATIGTSCIGSDGSFCNDRHSNLRTAGPHASIVFNDFIEVSGRVAWLSKPDIASTRAFESPSIYFIADRRRSIGQAEIIWHFRRQERVRVMFGLGLGRYWDREIVTCAPAGCEPLLALSGLTAGNIRKSHVDRSILVGLSARLYPRLRIRGGWRYHNPFNDENALSELFVGAAYQFELRTKN